MCSRATALASETATHDTVDERALQRRDSNSLCGRAGHFNHSRIARMFAIEKCDSERTAYKLECRAARLILKRHVNPALTQSGRCLLRTLFAVNVGHLR